ncbi:hypothetical protein [Nitrosopumilus sp.]|uniref:hypothetical protein n=1 Tax=Nitrosopumilus sp. TaxID=2024843 RepID=UPI0029316854|nr:hypothetical protein [Nitrosopumilus sp.]
MICLKSYDQQVIGFSRYLKRILSLLHIKQFSDQTKKYCCYLDCYAGPVDTREKKVIWKGADPFSLVFFSRLKTCLKERIQVLCLSSFDKDEGKVITKN